MKEILKIFISRLPRRWQTELKRFYFGHQIKKGAFKTDEKEFGLLEEWVREGDWVIDVGANIGHYTCKLSDIVGAYGRVIAAEPVVDTFELLASNVAMSAANNVTLLNVAMSDCPSVFGIEIPKFNNGLTNYYMAHLSDEVTDCNVLCLTIDSLKLPYPISLVKIDVEGHELSVLKGMRDILERDHPVLIVEDNSIQTSEYLDHLGYSIKKIEGSPNKIFIWQNFSKK